MRKVVLITVILVASCLTSFGQGQAYQFFSNKGKKLDFKDVVKMANKADVTFLGNCITIALPIGFNYNY
ncbi:hypothetical protein V8V91_24465 [Algoriphagus halophilus]|uniref:hypothetical protein n=1 Tax=Algoriphagus halophilus TaxID=226505 RepID=UPI00358F2F2D